MADELEARSTHIKSYTNDIVFFSFISKKEPEHSIGHNSKKNLPKTLKSINFLP